MCEHYWYNSWPDHGVPKKDKKVYVDDVVNMLKEVNAAMDTRAPVKAAPIVVHCSAGVGRTGTFIAVDWMQRALQTKGKFNVIDSIYTLREDRVALVQTADQYKFVHTACKQFCKMNKKKMQIVDAQHAGEDVFSPSVAGHTAPNETLVPMSAVQPINLDDIGKPCTVRRFEGTVGCELRHQCACVCVRAFFEWETRVHCWGST